MLVMRAFAISIAFFCFKTFASAQVVFKPIELNGNSNGSNNNRRVLRGNNGLNGRWGNLHQLGYCVQKVHCNHDNDDPGEEGEAGEEALTRTASSSSNGSSNNVDKVKFMPCDDWEPAQMWKFEHMWDGSRGIWYATGLLYNMDGGCLSIQGDIELGKNLKVKEECDSTNPKQQWWSDGDTLNPLVTMGPDETPYDTKQWLCVSAAKEPIQPRDPVLLTDGSLGSLDY